MRMTNKNEKITISVVGAGNRADIYIMELKKYYPNDFIINGVFDIDETRCKYFMEKYGVKKSDCYLGGIDEFITMPRISDVVVIATLDNMHFIPTIHALENGYDIILEKPISMTLDETVAIGKVAEKYPDQLVAVCHVLRHTPFFSTIKQIIDSKELGNVVNIQHNENVGYYHFAHSYVRGNWRNTDISAPFIVAKSCHDLDILLYLLGGKNSVRLSSMGSLTYFKKENYDSEKMAPRCVDCSIEKTCPYSAIKIYESDLIKSVVFNKHTSETLRKDLETSHYGKCVFNTDNNVADNQVTIIEFEDGVHATFNLSAFTDKNHRSIKIMCEKGEIRATGTTKEIEVTKFGFGSKVIKPKVLEGGHGGGDAGFMINFMETYLNGKEFDSTLEKSIQSHVMAFAAEESRLNNGQVIEISKYHDELLEKAIKKGLV